MASDIKLLDGDQILVEGNVGIGTQNPGYKLDVADRMRVREANGTAGIWFYQSKPVKDQAFVGMSTDTQVGFWGNTGAGWGLVMDTTTGNVGIGTQSPGYKLDVADRMRVRQANDTAGIWFYQTKPAKDQAFVGMSRDTQIGFWGNTGAGWGLVMDTGTGNVGIGTGQATPASKLQVNGTLRASSLQVLVPRERMVKIPGTTTGSPAPGRTAKPVGNIGSIKPGVIDSIEPSAAGSIPIDPIDIHQSVFTFPAISVDEKTGHVGIGVLSPSGKHQLDVRGNTQIVGELDADKICIGTLTDSEALTSNSKRKLVVAGDAWVTGGLIAQTLNTGSLTLIHSAMDSIKFDGQSIVLNRISNKDKKPNESSTTIIRETMTITGKTILIESQTFPTFGAEGSPVTVIDLVEEVRNLRIEIDSLNAKVKALEKAQGEEN